MTNLEHVCHVGTVLRRLLYILSFEKRKKKIAFHFSCKSIYLRVDEQPKTYASKDVLNKMCALTAS